MGPALEALFGLEVFMLAWDDSKLFGVRPEVFAAAGSPLEVPETVGFSGPLLVETGLRPPLPLSLPPLEPPLPPLRADGKGVLKTAVGT